MLNLDNAYFITIQVEKTTVDLDIPKIEVALDNGLKEQKLGLVDGTGYLYNGKEQIGCEIGVYVDAEKIDYNIGRAIDLLTGMIYQLKTPIYLEFDCEDAPNKWGITFDESSFS